MATWRVIVVFGSAMMLASVAAYATPDPCFDFDCEDSVCEFDASCSTELNPNTVWKIFWDFGDDNTNLGWTVAPTHEYGPICYPGVKLELLLWSGGKVTVSCLISTDNPACPGPPLSASGRCD